MFKTPKMLMPKVRYAKMVYRLNVPISGANLYANAVYPYGALDPTRICANSVYLPNRNGVVNGSAPVSAHAAAFEYFQNQFNCFEVLASKFVATWRQVELYTAAKTPFIIGVKLADDINGIPAPTGAGLGIRYYNIPNSDSTRYKLFRPDSNNNSVAKVRLGFSARRRWMGATPVQNTVTRVNGSFGYPHDQIWYIPFISATDATTVAMPAHQIQICVIYYVRWSDPRSIEEWNTANPNAEMTEADGAPTDIQPEDDVGHEYSAEEAAAAVEKIEAEIDQVQLDSSEKLLENQE